MSFCCFIRILKFPSFKAYLKRSKEIRLWKYWRPSRYHRLQVCLNSKTPDKGDSCTGVRMMVIILTLNKNSNHKRGPLQNDF